MIYIQITFATEMPLCVSEQRLFGFDARDIDSNVSAWNRGLIEKLKMRISANVVTYKRDGCN
jgi:hypothetical protein